MKRIPCLLILFLLAACAPVFAPPTATPTLTSTPTRTPTPAPTPTPSVTPTPSLPPEALTRLAGRDWRIEGDKVMAGGVAWYSQDAEGQWQPAQFVADFDSFQFSLEGLEIADEDGVVRIYDPNASDERARLVYEDGKVNILFAVERAKLNCEPTDFKPTVSLGLNQYDVAPGMKEAFWNDYGYEIVKEAFTKILKPLNLTMNEENTGMMRVVIDHNKNCWGWVSTYTATFFYRTKNGEIRLVPLMAGWLISFFK